MLVWGERPGEASLTWWLSAFIAISAVRRRSEREAKVVDRLRDPN
jgi:hypothetical protein